MGRIGPSLLLNARAMALASSSTTNPTTAMITAFLAFPRPGSFSFGALGHQHEPRPDDGEEAQAHPGVGHARQHPVEGFQHPSPLVWRGGGHGGQRRAGGEQDGCNAPYHGHQLHQEESPTGVCSALGGGGVGGGTCNGW